ncbi:MAG: cardiolipin synthase [Rhodothalassiaceae bacterium]
MRVDWLSVAMLILMHGFGVMLALGAARRSHTAQGALAWAMSLSLIPWLAIPAFLLLGPRRLERLRVGQDAARAAALEALAADTLPVAPPGSALTRRRLGALQALAPIPVVQGAPPKLLIDGEAIFEALFAAIDRAEHSIRAQFYILRDDGLGRRFKQALIARARDGLCVQLLYDSIGARRVPNRYWRELQAAGVQVRRFDIGRPLPRLLRINYRNHRKIVAVDSRWALLAGANIGDEYLGLKPRLSPWRDTAVALRGPAARAVEASFLEDWVWSGGQAGPARPDAALPNGGTPTLILPTGPADPRPACTMMICHLLTEARHRAWVASPYFVPELDVAAALKLAALRGVDVRVLIPDHPDHRLVWLAGFAYAEEMLRAGVKLYRYSTGFMHQKVMLIDSWAAAIGTANLDSRSLRLNFEITALLFDAGTVCEVAEMLRADFARARRYDQAVHDRRGRLVRVFSPLARLTAPLL